MAYTSRENTSINPYAVGNKVYGGGRPMPNIGPVDPSGYRERDNKAAARRNAIERRMMANSKGKYASADSQRTV
jgi:hypothetical protein